MRSRGEHQPHGRVPACVARTVATTSNFVGRLRDAWPNRRTRKSVARVVVDGPASYYDAGAFGRIVHYYFDHLDRREAYERDRAAFARRVQAEVAAV